MRSVFVGCCLTGLLSCCGTAWSAEAAPQASTKSDAAAARRAADCSPIDLVLGPHDDWLVAIDQTGDRAVLVRTADGKLLDEAAVGRRPEAIALTPDARCVLVTASHAGVVNVLDVSADKLTLRATIAVGFEPQGIAVAPDGRRAYVALAAAHQVAEIDLQSLQVTHHIDDVGRWPRSLALTPDGRRLAVAAIGEGGVTVIDTVERTVLYREKFKGLNLGRMQIAADGKHVFFPSMFYGDNPTTPGNIRIGWVLGSRLARIGMEGPGVKNAITLDTAGRAVADPYGLSIAPDGERLVISSSGTHELLLFATAGIPFIGIGGGEHINPALLADSKRFARIPVGGRPMGLKIASDSRTVYVANYLEGSVQVVDLDERKLVRSISIARDGQPAQPSLVRRGEAIFFDARRSLDQWYSCHSCHQDGGSNLLLMDTLNDGSAYTYKTVLPLYHVTETGPWTWHGWQRDLAASIKASFTSTMQGPAPSDEDVAAVIAYLDAIELPPNPHRQANGALTPTAERGLKVFQSEKGGCSVCHSGPRFTDGQIHDVGLGSSSDRYQGYNTASLVGVYRKVRLLHSGRATTLDELLTDPHNPAKVTGLGELTDEERQDLVAYLMSL